jgi:hypothetical protein
VFEQGMMGAMATKITLDDETAAVLARFNDGLERTKEHDRRVKVVAKAERAKDEAAKKVKSLEGGDASSEDRAEAQELYRTAAEQWQTMKSRLDAGEDPTPPPDETNEPDTADDADSDAAPAESDNTEAATDTEPAEDAKDGSTEAEASEETQASDEAEDDTKDETGDDEAAAESDEATENSEKE